jgi:hypothetical protein
VRQHPDSPGPIRFGIDVVVGPADGPGVTMTIPRDAIRM